MNSRPARTSATILALVSVFAAASVFADSDTWTGAADGDFANADNWAGGQVPGNTSAGLTATSDLATFNNAVNTLITVDAGRTVNRLVFEADSGPFSFTGSGLYFNGANNGAIFNSTNTVNAVSFFTPLFGGQSATAANRNITFSGNGSGNHALGVLFNVFGNATAGYSGPSGGTVAVANYANAMFRGVIGDPTASARTALSTSDHLTEMIWLKGANTYTGSTGAYRDMILFDTITPIAGGASSFGNATATTGNIVISESTGLYYVGRDPAGHTTDRVINYSYTYGSSPILYAAGAGPLRLAGNMFTDSNNSTKQYFNYVKFAGTSAQDNVFSGVLTDSVYVGGNYSARTQLWKIGEGTWSLAGANTYTEPTRLHAGTLRLDFAADTAPTDNIVNSASPLWLYDGVLAVRGKEGTAHSQTFNGTLLREGYTSIEVAPGASGGSVTVNLGALTRNSSVGTTQTGHVLNVSNPSGATVTTTHSEMTNGVLTYNGVSFATANKSDWATLDEGKIVRLSSYQTSTNPAEWTPGDNVSLAGDPSANVGNGTLINTLRLTANSTLTLDGNLTIGAGGILITGGNSAISGGNLTGGGNQTHRELIVVQNSAGAATIGSKIVGQSGTSLHLTKAGPGTLVLTQNMSGVANRWAETTIADGVLAVPSRDALGSSTTKFAGGQLGLTQNDIIAELNAGAASQMRFQIIGSWGFTAYGGTRSVDFMSTVNLADPGGNGELLLSSPDATGKIVLSSSTNKVLSMSRTYGGVLAGIRVFDGAEAVDAEIAMPLVSSTSTPPSDNTKGGIIKVGDGVLQLSAANTYNGPTIVREGGLIVTGSIPNSMLTEVHDGAWLGGNGTISSLEIHPGAKLAPGMSIGTLSTQNRGNGYFLWNGEADDTAPGQLQFELSETDATSDRLDLGTSEFLKGAGEVFKFDFLGTSGKIGETYTLISFGTTTFADEADFSYENLGGGNTGTFALGAENLTFTVVPEPGTIGLAVAGLALAALRRRMRG